MTELKTAWKQRVYDALRKFAQSGNMTIDTLTEDMIVAEFPPKPELGDIGFPMFSYAKIFRTSPAILASQVAAALEPVKSNDGTALGSAKAVGPYLNVYFNREALSRHIFYSGTDFAQGPLAGRKVMIEFSCPNTNKPLHLGHLRNNVLGESLSRIMKTAGAEVKKVNLINDRGIHICKSMLAYQVYGGGRTPEDEGLKSDHFVGKYYVLFNTLKSEDPSAEEKAQELLRKWESEDPDVMNLWETMNAWAVEGIKATYARQGISFDRYYFESQTYMKGKEEILAGLERNIFYREEDGSIWANLEDIGLDRKVLLRKDGTSLYITQDIGTAIYRHADWPFDQLIYVVASEQQYHFRVLFEILKRLGYAWAKDLYHLSYGLVNLPSGRMKTREGTVVDADDLIDELASMAQKEIAQRERESAIDDAVNVAEKIALGALHYYLLQTSPIKDMLYNPEQSLSFTGNTGPYIQYMGARACSILRKYEKGEGNAGKGTVTPAKLSSDADWILVRRLLTLQEAVELAARSKEPSVIAAYAHDLASDFSSWYRDNPVLASEDPDLSATRVELVKAVKSALQNVCWMLCIPFLEEM